MTFFDLENSLARIHKYIKELIEEIVLPHSYNLSASMNFPEIGNHIDKAFKEICKICEINRLNYDEAFKNAEIQLIIRSLINSIDSCILIYFGQFQIVKTPFIPSFLHTETLVKNAIIKEIFK